MKLFLGCVNLPKIHMSLRTEWELLFPFKFSLSPHSAHLSRFIRALFNFYKTLNLETIDLCKKTNFEICNSLRMCFTFLFYRANAILGCGSLTQSKDWYKLWVKL